MSFVFLHTVPNDPLVPTAVLGEALIFIIFFFFAWIIPPCMGYNFVNRVIICSAESSLILKIHSHGPIKENNTVNLIISTRFQISKVCFFKTKY